MKSFWRSSFRAFYAVGRRALFGGSDMRKGSHDWVRARAGQRHVDVANLLAGAATANESETIKVDRRSIVRIGGSPEMRRVRERGAGDLKGWLSSLQTPCSELPTEGRSGRTNFSQWDC